MEIVFIRHSKTILNKSVLSDRWILSEEGIKSSIDLAHNDKLNDTELIFTSFQTKALHTAVEIAKVKYIPIIPIQELTEASSITNGFFPNFETEVKKWHEGNYRINNGETKKEAKDRFIKAISYITSNYENLNKVVLISHANVLSIFAEDYQDEDSYTIHQNMDMPDIAVFDTLNNKFTIKWTKK